MALGTFTLKAKGKASSFDPRVNGGKPLIVIPREFRPNFTTQRFPNPKDVVIVDVVDLLADTVHVSVIWGGGAMVDAIKEHVPAEGQEPTKLPVKIQAASSAAGNSYYVLAPLEGQMLQLAAAWDAKYPTRVDQERSQHEAEQVSQVKVGQVDPMRAVLAALHDAPNQHLGPQSVTVSQPAAPVGGGDPAIAALQAQLAAALAAQGQTQAAQPVAQETQAAAPQPAMSDADLEAAIKALG
jgi:hypothetical protein